MYVIKLLSGAFLVRGSVTWSPTMHGSWQEAVGWQTVFCCTRMRVWKRVSLFLSVLVVLAALYMTPLFGNKPAVIVSGSMEPTIQTGAFILVHFSDFEDCEVGDVITYYHPGFDELVLRKGNIHSKLVSAAYGTVDSGSTAR